jgi:hypothetical protein
MNFVGPTTSAAAYYYIVRWLSISFQFNDTKRRNVVHESGARVMHKTFAIMEKAYF